MLNVQIQPDREGWWGTIEVLTAIDAKTSGSFRAKLKDEEVVLEPLTESELTSEQLEKVKTLVRVWFAGRYLTWAEVEL